MAKNTPSLQIPNLTARDIAVNCLMNFEQHGQPVQLSLNEIFLNTTLEPRQRHLATELAYGSCRHIITLDWLINKFSNRPLRNINPVIIQILRVGLYQMLYMNRTPDFAAVHQAVQQCRKLPLKGTPGFVNAILRATQREIKDFITLAPDTRWIDWPNIADPRTVLALENNLVCVFNSKILPAPERHWEKYLSLTFSLPPWLIKRWLTQYDKQTVYNICRAHNSRPNIVLRTNTLRCNTAKLLDHLKQADVQAYPIKGNSIVILSGGRCENLPGYKEGWFSVQDSTAALVGPILDPQPGQRILDLCAAPGGKTTHMAELMQNEGSIIASDVIPDKLQLIEQNCKRLGITIVQTALARDIPAIVHRQGLFDAVLIDAPCSNTGVLVRRTEARYRLKPADIKQLKQIQLDLLEQALQFVKPNGHIVYSTCSIDKTENEQLINEFLSHHPELVSDNPKLTLPGLSVPAAQDITAFTKPNTTDTHHPGVTLYHDGGFAVRISK